MVAGSNALNSIQSRTPTKHEQQEVEIPENENGDEDADENQS